MTDFKELAKQYRNCAAYVGIDMDENRIVYVVMIEDMDGNSVDRIPFAYRDDAEELSDAINEEVSYD